VVVVLDGGSFHGAALSATFEEALRVVGDAAVVAVDMPIGLPPPYPRAADLAARSFVGPRRNSVFLTPLRQALASSDYAEAVSLNRNATGKGISRQAFALRSKILEVDRLVSGHPSVIEVHPEVSFRELAGRWLDHAKRSWNGFMERRSLLAGAGLALPDRIEVAAPSEDVLDAAVAAWSASRYARGEAQPLPADPTNRIGTIWR